VSSPTTSPQRDGAERAGPPGAAAPGTPAGEQPIRSYTSPGQGVGNTLREFWSLYRGMQAAKATIERDVQNQIEDCRLCARKFEQLTGRALKGCKIVEVGAGQSLRRAREFAVGNDVTATDLDVYAHGLDVRAYLEVLRRNGAKRMAKTIGLRLFGTDRAYNRALARALNVASLPDARFRQMDATRLEFPDNSIDLVYSFQVFEHLPDPEAVWRECVRVVKPGGCIFTLLHLYTSDSGCHDLRIIRGDHSQTGYWPHLRESARHTVQNSAYLNELTLAQWYDLVHRVFPGADVEFERDDRYRDELARLRSQGELRDYSDDELLNRNMIVTWMKPRA
jgi:SAM-dependent methyltransferase